MEAESREDDETGQCVVGMCPCVCVGEALSKQGEIFIHKEYVISNVNFHIPHDTKSSKHTQTICRKLNGHL